MSAEHSMSWETYHALEFGDLPRDPYQSPGLIVDQAERATLQATIIDSIGMSEISQLTRIRTLARRAIVGYFDATGENLSSALSVSGYATEADLAAVEHFATESSTPVVPGEKLLQRIRRRFPELPPQLLGNPPRRTRMYDYDQFRLQR